MVELSFIRLFIWTAILFYPVQSMLCSELNPNENLKQQMADCEGNVLKFGNQHLSGIFDLSQWNQTDFDEIFYRKEALQMIVGKLVVRNSEMKKLKFMFSTGGALEVVGNTKLTHLSVKRTRDDVPLELKVRNNKQLRKNWIDMLNQLKTTGATGEVQESGECNFESKPIIDMSNLTKCEYVTGDLKIDSNTQGTSSSYAASLKSVDGCLEIIDSSLKNLKFLEKFTNTKAQCKNKITGNKELCLNSEVLAKLKNLKPEIKGNKNCYDKCTVAYAETHRPAKCNYIIGDININSGNVGTLKDWNKVEVLEGTITVVNTGIENMTIFPNLKEIIQTKGGKNALHILNNPKISIFKMPNLTAIQMPKNLNGRPFVWEKNGGFMFTYNEMMKWKNIIGRTHLHIPVDPRTVPPPPSMTRAPPASTTMDAALKEKLEEKKQTEKLFKAIEISTMVICIALALGAIFVVVALPLICSFINKRKRKNLQKKIKELRESTSYTPGVQATSKEAPSESGSEQKLDWSVPLITYSYREELTTVPEDDNIYGLATEKDAEEEKPFQANEALFNLRKALLEFFKEEWHIKQNRLRSEAVKMAKKQSLHAPTSGNPPVLGITWDSHLDQIIIGKMNKGLFEKDKPYIGRMQHFPKEMYKFTYNPRDFKSFKPSANWNEISFDPKDPIALLKRLLSHTGDTFQDNPVCFVRLMEWCAKRASTTKCYSEGTLRKVTGAWRMIGDIHGSIVDLLAFLHLDPNGEAAKHGLHPILYYRFIFLGDYVDRGLRSLECLGLVLLLGALLPDHFVIIRGNHEGMVQSADETFTWHMLIKYYNKTSKNGKKITGTFNLVERMVRSALDVIQYLPLAALVNGKIFCAHGGISHRMKNIGWKLDEIFEKLFWPYRTTVELGFLINPPGYVKDYNTTDVQSGNEWPNLVRKKCDFFPLEESNAEEKKWKELTKQYQPEKYKKEYLEKYKAKFGENFGNYRNGMEFIEGLNKMALDIYWSDFSPKVTFYKNARGIGNFYSDELLSSCYEFGIEMVVVAHVQEYFMVSRDGGCWKLFGSNNYGSAMVSKENRPDMEISPSDWSGIIDMIGKNRFRLLLCHQTTSGQLQTPFTGNNIKLPKKYEEKTKKWEVLHTNLLKYKEVNKKKKDAEAAKSKVASGQSAEKAH